MAVSWRILYGLIVLCGTILAIEKHAPRLQGIQKIEIVHGDGHKTNYVDVRNQDQKSNIKHQTVQSLNDQDIGPISSAPQYNFKFFSSLKDGPPMFLYHKTLKKIQGRPTKMKDKNGMLVDSRIRVNPIGFEPFQHLDFPLMEKISDLNIVNGIKGSRTRNNEDKVAMKKLKVYLKEAIRKSNQNEFRVREARDTNLTQLKPSQTWPKNKSELLKLLEASFPLQFQPSSAGLLKHILYKESDRKFRPEEFIMGISSDPSFSSINEVVGYENANKYKEEISSGKSNNTFMTLSRGLFGNNVTSLSCDASLNGAVDQQSTPQRIHQSAEETVFKNVLNELIADIPHNMDVSTRPGETQNIEFLNEILQDSCRVKEIQSRIKSAKHNSEDSTSNPKDSCPCMKIRVKNGPVTLTFQSEAKRGSTKKPFTDPSNVPVFKINSGQADANRSVLIDTDSLCKNVLSGLTDELNYGESTKDWVGKTNISSYSAYGIDRQLYPIRNPYSGMNNSGISKNMFQPNASYTATRLKSEFKFHPSISDEFPKKNGTDSTSRWDSNKYLFDKAPIFGYNMNNSVYKEKINESMKPTGTAAIARPHGHNGLIIPNYLNSVQKFGPAKHLFLTRTGTGSYHFANDADRLRLAAHLSRTPSDTRCKYVPKLYYNELVVSKGLVGQHPPKDDSNSAVLSDSTLKKMEMLNILKFYLDSLSPERNYSMSRNKEAFIFNPMLKNNRKYFIL